MEELSKALQQMMEDPGSRQNLLALVNAFSSGSVPVAAAPTGSTGTAGDTSLDLSYLTDLMNQLDQNDEDIAFLRALAPQLGADKQVKINDAIRLVKLLKILRAMGERRN